MATSAKIIVTNTTDSPIFITDLCSQCIDSTSQIILSDFYSFFEITSSSSLRTMIQNGTVTVSDDYGELTIEQAINHVSEITKHESKNKLVELDDVSDPPGEHENEMLVSDGTSIVWIDHLPNAINFTMSDHAAHDYVGNISTSYVTIRSFVFSGTNIWTPTKFVIIGSMSKSGATGYVRLFDYTNNNEIVVINYSAELKQIYSNENLSNLPSSQAIFELQLKTGTNGTAVRTHYMALLRRT